MLPLSFAIIIKQPRNITRCRLLRPAKPETNWREREAVIATAWWAEGIDYRTPNRCFITN